MLSISANPDGTTKPDGCRDRSFLLLFTIGFFLILNEKPGGWPLGGL
jgi:hypothetical protein